MTHLNEAQGFTPRATRKSRWLRRPLLISATSLGALLPMSRQLLGSETALFNLGLVLVLVALLLLGYVKRPPFLLLWVSAAALLPLGSAVSGTNSSVRSSLVVGGSLAVLCVLAPPVLARILADTRSASFILSTAFVVGQSISALAGLLQLAGLSVLGSTAVFGRATGIAGHPNVLGLMAGIAVLLCLAGLRSTREAVRWIAGLALLVNAAALIASGSLSAMLATGVALAFVTIAKRRFVFAFVAAVLSGVVAASASLVVGTGSTIITGVLRRVDVVTGSAGGGGAASIDVRAQTYEWAWARLAEDSVVGVGMDPLNAGTFDGVTVVHNFLLRGWYQGGLPVAVWLALLTAVVLFGLLLPSLKRPNAAWPSAIALAILTFASTAAFLNQAQYWLPLLFAMTIAGERLRRARGAAPAGSGGTSVSDRTSGTARVADDEATGREKAGRSPARH